LALNYASDTEKANRAARALLDQVPDCHIRLYPRPLAGLEDAAVLAAAIQSDFSRNPAVLVTSHGRIRDGLFLQNDFQAHLDTVSEHLVATMALVHVFLKGMYRERFGRIIVLSSISARYAKRGQVGYATAKGGLEAMVRTLALEVAHRGITVNAIAPGLIHTPMTEPLVQKFQSGEWDLRKRVPVGFLGTPEDVADLVAHLVSPSGRYITGSILTIDGGRSLGDTQS
jgi:NAD(P)-dependent dehydrogenase (short-subunit alcohol dehydrogenase family)